ncbi:hypothetical protein N7450_010917 [Penicillium hetheringtonii]|uniref:Uncharacterized protein n=1 Tax=Penicillium hetheringtonii TaxID=911720 RepID=A0AAD6GKH3_9EURO|nr:hypothetical protein N7450_010917 [Penicillium hetheringtonii]
MDRRESIIDLTSAPAPESTHRQPSWDITSVDFDTDSDLSGYGSTSPSWIDNARSRGVKRQRSGDDSENAGPSTRPRVEEHVQAIDLTEVDSSSEFAKTLSNLREDAVKAQQPSEKATNKTQSILGAYKCPVCMDTPEDATSTACGTCPVCRKSITKNDSPGPRRSLIPLKLKLTSKKRNVITPTEA